MAKTNSPDYWEKRIAQETWKTYNSQEEKNKELLEFYMDASKSIKEELYALAEKYSRDGVLSLSDIYKNNRLKKLKMRYEQIAKDLGQQIEKSSKENMQAGFARVYESTMTGLDAEDFTIPDKKLMEKMLNTPWRGDSFSGRLWKNQKKLAAGLNEILLTGLQQGKTVTEIAVNLHNFTGNSFNACHRLVRTETMHYLNEASRKGYKDAGVQKVQFWAAEDERTCETCGAMHEKIYPIEKAPILPLHPHCRCTWLPVLEEEVIKDKKSGILKPESAKEVTDVHPVGKIDRKIYSCITKDIATDEVIITDNQIQHIKDRHPDSYKQAIHNLRSALEDPDYIIEDKHKNTGLVIKQLETEEGNTLIVLRICTSEDEPGYKNSVISSWEISDRRLQNYLRNKRVLYKKA